MKVFFIFLLGLNFNIYSQYSQIGLDIDGEISNQLGYSLALSGDGNRVVCGAFAANQSTGLARVYEFDGLNWIQIGNDLNGQNVNDSFGASVTINNDGSIVAISSPNKSVFGGMQQDGIVQVFSFNGSFWEQLGQNIVSEFPQTAFGSSISISSTGNRIIIGSSTSNPYSKIFEYDGTNWNLLGQNLLGVGRIVTMDPVGSIVAASDFSANGTVKIYSYNGSSWVQIFNDINGNSVSSGLGTSLSLSNDGELIAIGIHGDQEVRVFTVQNNQWVQFGQTLVDYLNSNGVYNGTVSINDFGDYLVIGSQFSDAVGNNSGSAKIYNYDGVSWVQIGNEISGEFAQDRLGVVSISNDGQRVALGARYNEGGGIRAGHVRVFEKLKLEIEETNNFEGKLNYYPNPTNGILNVISNDIFTELHLYDLTGRFVEKYQFSKQISLNINKGVYIIKAIKDGVIIESQRIFVQ